MMSQSREVTKFFFRIVGMVLAIILGFGYYIFARAKELTEHLKGEITFIRFMVFTTNIACMN